MLPSILSPYSQGRAGQNATPKPTPVNLRKFAETPVCRRAINVVKDKIASMDWKIKVRRGYSSVDVPDAELRMQALRQSLEEPNISDSFRVVFEQVLEDLLVGGFGAVEMEATGEPRLLASDPKHRWIDHVALGPDGAVAWSAGKSAFVLPRARGKDEAAREFQAPSTVGGLAFLPKGFRLAIAHYNGATLWFPNAAGAEPEKLEWKG